MLIFRLAYGQFTDNEKNYNRTNTYNCDFCLCSQGISPLDFSGKGIKVDPRYLLIDRLVENNRVTENTEGSYEKHFTVQVSLTYPVTKKISVITIIPYSIREGKENIEEKTTYTSGLGDIILFGRFNAYEKHNINSNCMISAQIGLKFPNGKSDEKNRDNEYIDAHLQTGTGSIDILGGANFLYSYKKFSVLTNLLFSLKTEGITGYRFGNVLNYDILSRFKLFQNNTNGNILFISGGIRGEIKAMESQDGIFINNSGGSTTYITGGINYYFSPFISFEAQFQKPVLYILNGIQDAETIRIVTGIQFII